jgi:hypothetical protein
MLSAMVLAIAMVAGILAARREEDAAPQTRADWIRTAAYWLFTVVVAFEMAAGGIWDLLRIEYVRAVLTHLGYPLYLLYIIGVPKIPCALVLLAPRFARLKEWAYAGAFFNYAGAAASHFLAGDSTGKWAVPLLLALFTLASWALRPGSRRLQPNVPAVAMRPLTWATPILICAAMIGVAWLTMPK